MPRPPSLVKTLHYMAIVRSLEAQNNAIMQLIAIAQDVVVYQDRSGNLATLVFDAERYGWMPGNVTGIGWTIIETVFESVAE